MVGETLKETMHLTTNVYSISKDKQIIIDQEFGRVFVVAMQTTEAYIQQWRNNIKLKTTRPVMEPSLSTETINRQ